jgi:hypothetical protein
MSGLVANYLKPTEGKIGRITGLDPTIFVYAGSNNSRDLDPSDAHFVDILHSSAGILGQWQPGGHADFYINGKKNFKLAENFITKKFFQEGHLSPVVDLQQSSKHSRAITQKLRHTSSNR